MLSIPNRHQFTTLLDAAVLRDPAANRDAIVYVESGQPAVHVSRLDFREAVYRQAAALAKIGVKSGDLVIIAHTQSLESIYAFWGAMLLGAMPSMFPTLTEKLDEEVYMRGMAELTQLSSARAILTSNEFAPVLDAHVPVPVYGAAQLPHSPNEGELPPIADPDPESIAFLQHSSGTTGLQKGVALSHEAVLNQLASYGDAIQLETEDVVVSWLPLYHDMGLIAGFLMPLVQGISLVLMSPFDWVRHPALLFQAIHDHQGTLCWLPNFAYNHCARRIRQRDLEGLSAATMRLFVNCSEPVYHQSHGLFMERFSSLGVRPEILSVSYAMAENTFGVTQTRPGSVVALDTVSRSSLEGDRVAVPVEPGHPEAQVKVSCGPPIAGTAVKIVDDGGRKLSERHVGEVAIRSDCMLAEYYRRPDLQPFRDGWYRTGDMGYIAGGELYVVGRSKDLIINAGKNIYPQDIEAIVNEVPGVHPGRVVAFGVADAREGTELVAVVAEVDLDDEMQKKAINKAIRQEVARQSTITLSYVHLVGPKWLLKTSSGKIARAANRDKWRIETGVA
jgi:fatty-acyl-CoA synthase